MKDWFWDCLGCLLDESLSCRRNEIGLCARLLGVSAHALNSNPGLILLVVVTKIVMTLAILPMFAFMFLAYTNGHIGQNGVLSMAKDPVAITFPACPQQESTWKPKWVSECGPLCTPMHAAVLGDTCAACRLSCTAIRTG